MSPGPLRVGTRASPLALAQAGTVARELPGAELVPITTSGDRDRAALDKERWVRELDQALLDGTIELAIHSAKDVPAELPDGLAIIATPPRASPHDALCGAASLDELAPGARIGTSSLRRAAQLRALRPDLELLELRGNIDTRLQRLASGDYDAIVLARAGLERLGRSGAIGCTLEQLVPSGGQGTLALVARTDDARAQQLAGAVDHPATHRCLLAERELVRALRADCHTPVGAHATIDGELLHLTAFVGREDGSAWLRDALGVAGGAGDPEAVGAEVGRRLLAAGADAVLGR